MPTILDYSEPLSDLLKESTKDVHKALENSEGAKTLLSGNLSKEDYILFLMMLWHVYDTLERGLERHASHPALEPTYNPTLLARAPAISEDITFLTQSSSWKSSQLFKELSSSPPEPLREYTSRIQEVADKEPARLLAHAYVRYLGDMSGGQNIRRIMAKAYDLDEQEGSGLKFYDFKELNGNQSAGLGELRRIKDWYRAGMNSGSPDVESKEAITDEASRAFMFNAGLFDFMATEPEAEDLDDQINGQPILLEGEKGESWQVFNMTSFVTVLLAFCVGHFILTVGGFTGAKGWQKLLTFEGWVAAMWPNPGSIIKEATAS